MRMKSRICCGIIGVASLLASPSLFAQTVIGTGSLYITAPGYPPDQAGPYNVTISTSPLPSGIIPISSGGSFETFCLGTQVNYTPGSTYSYQISDTVQPTGGVEPPGYDYVTWGTAWLYSQYRAGLVGDGSNIDGKNDALQGLIWYLQGQSTTTPENVTYSPDMAYYNILLTEVEHAAFTAGVSDTSDANGAFGVYALDMYNGSPIEADFAQPQLCLVPVPEPTTFLAGGLMLLPFGVSVLRIVRKHLA